MRVILFRGKRGDNKKLVYGFYWFIESHRDEKLSGKHFIKSINNGIDYEVIPETVGQYTGREDKNGMSMFEGDIFENEDGIGFIRWSSDMCAFVIEYFDYPDDIMLLEQLLENTKVIGNIYEKGK